MNVKENFKTLIEEFLELRFSDRHYQLSLSDQELYSLFATFNTSRDKFVDDVHEHFHTNDKLSYRKESAEHIKRTLLWRLIELAREQLEKFNSFIKSKCDEDEVEPFLDAFDYYKLYLQDDVEQALNIKDLDLPDLKMISGIWWKEITECIQHVELKDYQQCDPKEDEDARTTQGDTEQYDKDSC